MNLIMVYDTETTGLPDWNKPSEDPCQPRVTQLCAELCDDDTGSVVAALHTVIKPEGWVIPPDLEKLTGITTEKAERVGLAMGVVLPAFLSMWQRATVHRVAHNESFDMRMIRIELMRDKRYAESADTWKAGKAFCTQAKSQPILKLPPTMRMLQAGRKGFKSPNLGEAYKHFTGTLLEGAHDASVDVMACRTVYFAIKRAA